MKNILTATLLLTSTLSFAGGWEFYSKTDEMTDNTIRSAGVYSKDRTARLWVRCNDDGSNVINYNNFDFYIMTSNVTDTSNGFPVFRIDSNPPVTAKSAPSTNRRGEFIDHSQGSMMDIISQLKSGNTVKVKLGMYVGNHRIYKFGLSGSTKAINKVMKDCPAFY